MRRGLGRAARLAAAATVAVACAAPGDRGTAREDAVVLADLDGSLAPVRAWFDGAADRPRALLLLSPT